MADQLTRDERKRLCLGWISGAAPVLGLYTWVLTAGRADLFQRRFFDNFFDAQGRALANGRLDMPADVVMFEGFVVDDRIYMYFGLFPTLIRMPVLAVTDSYDGRLTSVSMLAAMVVLAYAAFRLTCALRPLIRGNAPIERGEVIGMAPLAIAALSGPPVFLASTAAVYHEATIWGVALSIAGFDAVVRWQRDPTGRRLALASLFIALALLSRQAIALGPLIALALAGAVDLARRFRQKARNGDPMIALRQLAPTAAVLALALLLAAGPAVGIHYAKFGMFLGVPMDKQVQTRYDESRAELVTTNPTYLGVEYLSTTSWQYFRPDAFDIRRDFPWIDFPREGPTLVNPDVVFDTLDWSSSMPVTAPALTTLSLVGLVWSVRTRRLRSLLSGPDDSMAPIAVGAGISGLGVLAFAYVAHRYLADLYPLFLIGGVAGFHVIAGTLGRRPVWLRRATIGTLAVMVGAGLVVNLALTLVYQRERGHNVPQEWHAEWVAWRLDLPGSTMVVHIDEDDPLPGVADGAVLTVGDCDAVYAGVKDRWLLVEEAPDSTVCRAALD